MDDLNFSQYVHMAVAGGNEGQLVAVGEEEVHSTLDFCNCGQWGGWGDLAVVEQGGRGHDPRERPARMHQQQPHAAAVSASHCLFCCCRLWRRDMINCLFVCTFYVQYLLVISQVTAVVF